VTRSRPQRPWHLCEPEQREYFDVLGDGLVAYVPGRRPGGGQGGWSPPTGGAWLHVGTQGKVQAFIGKVDVGQGTRTALALLVAEELRVPLEDVEMIMGDTDLCPWDMGTFGSRSMPDAAPAIQGAGAAARHALLARASAQLGVSVSELDADHGGVGPKGGAVRKAYGELLRGQRLLVRAAPSATPFPAADWRTAGHLAHDPRAADVVTGRTTYTSDLRLPDMLYGAVLHAPTYGAQLGSFSSGGLPSGDDPVVVYEGDFVGVAARSPREAHVALGQLQATWKEKPQPKEEEIDFFLRSHRSEGDDWDTDEDLEGDPDGAFARAEVRLEATFHCAYIAHVPLETRAAVAKWEGDRLTIWVGTQTPFRARDHVAEGLGIPPEKVRVLVPPTGSGFGGKHGGDVALAASRLARAAHRPVLVSFSREEEFSHGYLRPYAIIDVRASASKDGSLTSWSLHNVNAGSAAVRTPYQVANRRVGNELSASPLPQGSYRALAANTNNFAREVAMDELAIQLGVDPFEFRDRNLKDDRLREVLRRAAEAAKWTVRERVPGRGFGIAAGLEKNARVATVAEVRLGADRSLRVERLVTAFESGAIVHPDNLRSQVEGACVMALGGALFEAIHFGAGRIKNPRLSTYRVPRFSDLPTVEVVLVDRKDLPPGGAGETPMIAVAPAVANAIYDAGKVRLRSLPLVPNGRVPAPS
jgi:nicotinate dehydrogenase subunit B